MGNPAARIGDMHVCPMVTPGLPPIPHVGGPVVGPAVPTVLIGGVPAAVLGDTCTCVGPPDSIMLGSFAVLIGGKPAARLGDPTIHGGSIIVGLPTVLIGGPAISALRPISVNAPGFFKGLWNKFLELFGIQPTPPPITYGPFTINYDPDNPDFQVKALAALIRLDNTPTMNAAFNDIENSGHKVQISNYTSRDPYYASMGPNNAYAQPEDQNKAQQRGVGCDSKVAWNPEMHGYGNTDDQNPGSDVILGHEMIHAAHNANGTQGSTYLYDQNGDYYSNMEEERNTVGLGTSTYNNPPGWTGGPADGSTLPDTSSPASAANGGPGNYTENSLRQDLASQGYVNPSTGKRPVQRPSYGDVF
jgi:uncharacterized Zn-binding protein involved in type VI secretion